VVRHIGIIGAGLAGLAVAFRRQLEGDQVSLFEASPRFGGQLDTERNDGFVIEHGAEGFVAGSSAVAELSRSLGIDGRIIDQEVSVSCTFDGERLIRLAPGEAGRMLGFQVGTRAFGKGIQSFAGGMSELAETLLARLLHPARGQAAVCALGTPVAALRANGARWQIIPKAGAPVEVDQVVVAVPAQAAAALLGGTFGSAALALASSQATSSVTVSLAFARGAVEHALDATGFVVAEPAQAEGFRACTFVSSKLRGRAPSDAALLRLFFRPTQIDLASLDDRAWTERALRSSSRALDIRSSPERAWVSRWVDALPVFDDAHRQRVTRLEEQLQGTGIGITGASFHGSGIDGAVRSAEAAARALG
jgi:oxygen-dependent protoporphyrinogen oxidase